MFRLESPLLHVAAAAALLTTPVLAGCTGGPLGEDVDESLALTPIRDELTTAPGGTVAFPLTVSGDAPNGTISLEIVDEGSFSADATPPRENTPNGTGFFVSVDVPGDADTGEVTVRANAANATGPSTTLTVNVEEPDEVVEAGDQIEVDYTGRFPNGSVFATSVEGVGNGSIPKAPLYQGGGSFEPLNVTVGPNASFIKGFNDGLMGVGVGHDSSFSVPPEDAYGNETTRKTMKRVETLERNITQERIFNLSRSLLERQGLIDENTTEGDNVTVGSGERARIYNVTFLNETKAELTLIVEEGDTYTHYAAWPNSSEAVFVNETHVSYRVTPTTDLNEFFTWNDFWPNATKVTEINNETITIRHSPDIGTTWTPQQRAPGRSPPERTVVDLTEESVVYEQKNQHPLAGETLVFDVHVLGVHDGGSE